MKTSDSVSTTLQIKLLFCLLFCYASLFSLICFSLFLIFYSLVGSSAMMGPHLAACLRNDKLGEPCFYLMSQNQATVCRALSVCAMPPHHFICPCVCFIFIVHHPLLCCTLFTPHFHLTVVNPFYDVMFLMIGDVKNAQVHVTCTY